VIFVIQSFRHKGLENFFRKSQTKGIKVEHVKKLRQILGVLNAAMTLEDIKRLSSHSVEII